MPCLKTINASQAYICQYQNLTGNYINCNANIYFNQKCIQNNIVPKFAKINIPNTSPASKFTHTQKLCLDMIYILFIHVCYLLEFSHMKKTDMVNYN